MAARMHELAPGVHAWIDDQPGHGRTNTGIVLEGDGATLVDCQLTPARAAQLAVEVDLLGNGTLPVRRVVYTSSHAEAVGGSSVFWMAARYGRAQASARLDQPANIDALRRLYPTDADEFDEDFATRPVSHMVTEPAWLTEVVCAVPCAGEERENLVVVVPSADVVFAGAMCCFGTTPNAFDGDPGAWADALGDIAELAAVVVPGIGPIGGADEILALQAYLWACVDAEGDPARIPSGPWDAWTDRHFDTVNVERAAMLSAGDPSVPPSMLALLGL